MKLVIYKNEIYQQLEDPDEVNDVLLGKPFTRSGEEFWVPASKVTDYPRTYEHILERWIPGFDKSQTYHASKYVLEILSGLLTPQFLNTPSSSGFYTAFWMDNNDVLQITWILYNPDDPTLTELQKSKGYDTFVLHIRHWMALKHYIADPEYRYLRFVPLNLGYTYTYLQHLIEAGYFTREEVEAIWKRDK